ncbi:hypothetical protein AFE_1280 [Acidithiobacillus ferrooxidans ATCC 23270]|uniref:Uncharacterized protein n=1 Tax=Acidithiobacillus ferrooxidans (strain ATCC 23270 / DSM 14882 / CIP 104768 / NCIMB 8455) TaxID=243159 RepID=B7J8W2_ACIF2|nr:hypothetical protein AFE_1280 [Acidithiobacillus ferrooxidans ATCC 23270]
MRHVFLAEHSHGFLLKNSIGEQSCYSLKEFLTRSANFGYGLSKMKRAGFQAHILKAKSKEECVTPTAGKKIPIFVFPLFGQSGSAIYKGRTASSINYVKFFLCG